MTSPLPGTDTLVRGPLTTKYHCKVDKETMDMDVVMKMIPPKDLSNTRLPLRYVFVLDISGSMNQTAGNDNFTMLQRVQKFADIALDKIHEKDCFSIVTFSNEATIDFQMQPMTPENKKEAKKIFRNLQPEGATNIGSGLLKALEAIDRAPTMISKCRNCIILFTDGEPNEGIVEPEKLIKKFKERQQRISTDTCIPVSAFSIGGHRPDFLIKISQKLGSDAFYWLDDKRSDFEADMWLPFVLRERTRISDVKITVSAMQRCYFEDVEEEEKFYENTSISDVEIHCGGRPEIFQHPTVLNYFIHCLHDEKTLRFKLKISTLEDLRNKRVMNISVDYRDDDLNARKIKDYVKLITSSNVSDPNGLDRRHEEQVPDISSYTIAGEQQMTSYRDAQIAYAEITEDDCRRLMINSIGEAHRNTHNGDLQESSRVFEEAHKKINKIKVAAMKILPPGSESAELIKDRCHVWSFHITHAHELSKQTRMETYAILSSIRSSVESQCPVGSSVLEGDSQIIVLIDINTEINAFRKTVFERKLPQLWNQSPSSSSLPPPPPPPPQPDGHKKSPTPEPKSPGYLSRLITIRDAMVEGAKVGCITGATVGGATTGPMGVLGGALSGAGVGLVSGFALGLFTQIKPN